MLRRTKIVATLGPATDDLAVLADMVRAGLDVARLNFSHGTGDDRSAGWEWCARPREHADKCIGMLADLAGPKIRIESFREGKVQLLEGAPFALDTALDPRPAPTTRSAAPTRTCPPMSTAGDTLLLADGQIVLEVEKVIGTRIERWCARAASCPTARASIARAAASRRRR